MIIRRQNFSDHSFHCCRHNSWFDLAHRGEVSLLKVFSKCATLVNSDVQTCTIAEDDSGYHISCVAPVLYCPISSGFQHRWLREDMHTNFTFGREQILGQRLPPASANKRIGRSPLPSDMTYRGVPAAGAPDLHRHGYGSKAPHYTSHNKGCFWGEDSLI